MILGLGVGMLCVTIAMVHANEPADHVPAPRPKHVALGGSLVELTAEAGPGCFAPMLDELRRHPRWSIRIDDLEWDDVVDGEPDPRRAAIVLDVATGTWRDGRLPQSLTLAEDERRALLAAFALDCRVDPAQPRPGYSGRYIGVALGEHGPAVAHFPTNSFIALRLGELFDQIRARYVAGRAGDLRGFSLDLAGMRRTDRDDQGRSIWTPYRMTIRERDLAANHTLEDRVQLLDWAMSRPVALPASNHVISGTLRAYGTSRPIAVDLFTDLTSSTGYPYNSELSIWSSINRE